MSMQTSEGGVIVPEERQARGAVAPVQKSTDLMAAIAQAVVDPRMDVEKMRAMFDMRNEELSRVARQAYAEAMAKAQSEITPVVKRATNKQTDSKYALLEDVVAMIAPIYSRHGFSMSFGTVPGAPEGCIRTVCDLRHEGGHSEHYELDMELDNAGIGGKTNKTGPHARGSSISYCRRYMTCMIWNIPTGDDDDGNAAGGMSPEEQEAARIREEARQPISDEQRRDLQERLEATGADVAAFCRLCKVNSLAEMPVGKLPSALERIQRKAEKAAEASKGEGDSA